MKLLPVLLTVWLLLANPRAGGAQTSQALPHAVELKASDGTLLKASYLSAGKPDPGVLLFHQTNRSRTSWDRVARQLAAAGIYTVAVDGRDHRESGGAREDAMKKTPAGINSLVMLLGDSFPPDIEFLQEAAQLPELFVRAAAASEGAVTAEHAPGSEFRDCPDCPQMVVIPAGNFIMGSSSAERSWAAAQVGSAEGVADESPQHAVSLPSFAMGKYDVTRGEYAEFVRGTGHSAGDGCARDSFEWKKEADRSWQKPGFNQTDRDPVVCVSWQDAQAYVAWLNGRVRQKSSASGNGPYRLPSESEWEYAARAGRGTRFWWGEDDVATSDYAWYKKNSGGRTHPVGLKLASDFGLYDMVGNVWQWTEDCYAKSYVAVPADGSANEGHSTDPDANDAQGKCLRVDRGASWMFRSWALRSATRERNPADFRDAYMGFRLARSLLP